jgi:acyl dehydratase
VKALYLEELPLGETFRLGNHTFTAQEVSAFPFPQSLLAATGWMKCYVNFNATARAERVARQGQEPPFGPSPGVDELKLQTPVKAGDTVTYTSTPTTKRAFASKPGWGIYESANEGRNQRDELVVSFKAKVLIAAKA